LLLSIISFFIVCVLYFYGFILFYITYLAKKKREKEAFINNFFISLIFTIALSINLIIIFLIFPTRDFIVFPFDVFMGLFLIFFIPFFIVLVKREQIKIKKGKRVIKSSTIDTKYELPLKYEIYRKLTHLVVLGIILFYFTLGFLVQNFFIYIFQFTPDFISELFFTIYNTEDDKMMFTQYLVIFLVGISLIGMSTADFVRILKPELYPLKPINRLLREKERYHLRLGPQISMSVGCFSIIIIFGHFQPIGPLVICTTMTMAIFGDMASNLIGRSFGYKYKNIRDTKKTYIGLFSGIFVSFISGIIVLVLLGRFYYVRFSRLILLPLIGSLIIGLIDYVDLEIDDNLSFNFVTTTILFFILIFLI